MQTHIIFHTLEGQHLYLGLKGGPTNHKPPPCFLGTTNEANTARACLTVAVPNKKVPIGRVGFNHSTINVTVLKHFAHEGGDREWFVIFIDLHHRAGATFRSLDLTAV